MHRLSLEMERSENSLEDWKRAQYPSGVPGNEREARAGDDENGKNSLRPHSF